MIPVLVAVGILALGLVTLIVLEQRRYQRRFKGLGVSKVRRSLLPFIGAPRVEGTWENHRVRAELGTMRRRYQAPILWIRFGVAPPDAGKALPPRVPWKLLESFQRAGTLSKLEITGEWINANHPISRIDDLTPEVAHSIWRTLAGVVDRMNSR